MKSSTATSTSNAKQQTRLQLRVTKVTTAGPQRGNGASADDIAAAAMLRPRQAQHHRGGGTAIVLHPSPRSSAVVSGSIDASLQRPVLGLSRRWQQRSLHCITGGECRLPRLAAPPAAAPAPLQCRRHQCSLHCSTGGERRRPRLATPPAVAPALHCSPDGAPLQLRPPWCRAPSQPRQSFIAAPGAVVPGSIVASAANAHSIPSSADAHTLISAGSQQRH